jgi:DEAD/DEAH box helicase domain-containing protein
MAKEESELMDAKHFLTANGWNIIETLELPPRQKEAFGIDDLPLATTSRKLLTTSFPGIYRHQHEAIAHFLAGANVCMATGTASGKSLAFYVAAIEHLSSTAAAKVIAIYPLKALGREQEDRWKTALSRAGIAAQVGRIDGQVPVPARLGILQDAQVLIVTPDIIHAWFLSNLSDKLVVDFLKNVALIIVDEVHNYTGVFGSNAAFLFRRMQHIMHLLGTSPQYMCASATISAPKDHLSKLFGLNFTLIGPESDTSPRHQVEIHLVVPPKSADLLTETSDLLYHLASQTSARFIAFVDSRKQVEHISSILARPQDRDEEREIEFKLDHLARLNVLPFRAGYEEEDRDGIQDRLRAGSLRGVVSTSALELGIDIPFLDTGVLLGVPRSATSLLQRIGRIGRHTDGQVLVVNTGDLYNEAIFADPQSFLNRPLAEGALYLENSRIRYIHALCLARQGGEHDQACSALRIAEEADFSSPVHWPDGFIALCNQERLGQIAVDLQSMKLESGDDPNHTFPLRDAESQFKVELKQGPDHRSLGSLSYGQLLREAYPGAVYYYITQPFRVYKVSVAAKLVQVRREKRYTTRPQPLPTLVFPNLGAGNVYRSKQFGDLIVAECNLQIRESLGGLKERRGPNEFSKSYPLDYIETGVLFKLPRFTRNYFTTGIIITHPALNQPRVNREALAGLLYEAFLILIPFERQDVSYAVDKHRTQQGPIAAGSAFLAIFDQTYGSLRLSGRMLEDDILQRTMSQALDLCPRQRVLEGDDATLAAMAAMCTSLSEVGSDMPFGSGTPPPDQPYCGERVILPGSKGLNINHNNEEFEVEAVFFHPSISGLSYRGRRVSITDETLKEIVPLKALVEIAGESKMGFYNYDTGEIEVEA